MNKYKLTIHQSQGFEGCSWDDCVGRINEVQRGTEYSWEDVTKIIPSFVNTTKRKYSKHGNMFVKELFEILKNVFVKTFKAISSLKC